MCGICGKVGPEAISEDELRFMADTMAHRGPDDAGYHVQAGMGFGHRRLSIIDLDGGHQPISNEDGTVWITFNGEIYNYRKIRQELIAAGHRFRTNSDTETIVHLWEERGEECVKALRGMFCFAIWDANQRKLFLARDHMGQKPLYYAVNGQRLVFASEIKALLADNPGLARVDPDALKEYLTLRVISDSRSMFRGIRKLPPAHTLTFQDGKVEARCYWQIVYEPKQHGSEKELIDALEEKMLDAVRLHLVSDVEVGAFLSGGLDSSLIVAMISRITQGPLKTFSVGVPYQGYSELPYAEAVVKRYSTHSFARDMKPSVRRDLAKVIWHLDEPADPLAACMLFISEMTRREVKVVLGGDGGDELFGGYDRYYGNRYVNYYAALPRLLREKVLGRLIRHVPDGFWYKSLSHKLRWMHELSSLEGGRRYARSLSYFYFPPAAGDELFGPVLKQASEGFLPEDSISGYFDDAAADDLVDRMLYADCKVRLPNHSVMILDRTSMAYGLEARSPFLDHELVEFCATIPASLKVKGRSLRYIQTELARRYLPDKVIDRPKQGFSIPLNAWLQGPLRDWMEELLSARSLEQRGWFRPKAVRSLMDDHLNGRRDFSQQLWALMILELWLRRRSIR